MYHTEKHYVCILPLVDKHVAVQSTSGPIPPPHSLVFPLSCWVRLIKTSLKPKNLLNPDYILQGEDESYSLNICGPMTSDCSNKTCLMSGERLTYLEGSLEMNIGGTGCSGNTTSNLTAR